MTVALGASGKSVSPRQVTKSATLNSPWIRECDAAVDVEHVARALRRTSRRGEEEHRLGDVVGDDVHLQRRPGAIVILELLGLEAVRARALLAPGRIPDAGALEDGVGVDGVDAD